MARNIKIVLISLFITTMALPSGAMIQQSAVRQAQKPVRGTVERPVQPQSDGIKPAGKTSTPATTKPITKKTDSIPQPIRTNAPVAAGGPSIHMVAPTFGVTVQSSVTVIGVVDNLSNGLSLVTVNGITATINGQTFNATVTGLTTGQVQLIITATDGSGNSSTFTQSLTVDTDNPVWANISPEGIKTQSIVVDPSNPQTLYATSSQLGIVKTTNGGKDWYRTGSGLYGVLTVDPSNSNVIYLVSGAAIFKSADAGMSWTLMPMVGFSARPGPPIMVDPFNSQHLLLTRDDLALESSNAGQNWRIVTGLPEPITAVGFDPFVSGTVYAGGSAVFKSVDNGTSWTSSGSGMDAYLSKTTNVFGFYPDPLNPGVVYGENTGGRIFKTVDAATTWVPLDLGIGIYGDIEFDRIQSGVLCVTTYLQEILRTIDNGATWTRISAGIPDTTSTYIITDPIVQGRPGPQVKFVRIDPSSGTTIYATTSAGIFKTTDAGATWKSANKNLYGLAVTAIATSKSNPQEIIAGTNTGEIYKTVDSGQTWSRVDPPTNPGYTVVSIVIDPSNPDIIDTSYFETLDGGKTWFYNPKFFAYHAFASDPSNPNIRYAGDEYGDIFRTLDGTHWKTVFVAPEYPSDPYFKTIGPRINCLAVNPKNSSIVYAGTQRSLYRSTDYGTTWVEVHRPESSTDGVGDAALSFAIDPLHPNMVYAATQMSLLSSFDMGATWSDSNAFAYLDAQTELRLDPNATNNFYIASKSETLVSTDRGHTWKDLPRDFAGNYVNHLIITNDNPSVVFGSSENGGISKLIPAVPKVKIALGDVNRDGMVNVLDLSQLANGLAGNTLVDNPQADLNHNGEIDLQDLIKLAQFLAGNATLN